MADHGEESGRGQPGCGLDSRARGGLGAVGLLTAGMSLVVGWCSEQPFVWVPVMAATGAATGLLMWYLMRKGRYAPAMIWIVSGVLLAALMLIMQAAPTAEVRKFYEENPTRQKTALLMAGVMVVVGLVSLRLSRRRGE